MHCMSLLLMQISTSGEVLAEREWRRQNLEWERRRREAVESAALTRTHQRDVDERRARMVLRQQQKDEDSRRRRAEEQRERRRRRRSAEQETTTSGEEKENNGAEESKVTRRMIKVIHKLIEPTYDAMSYSPLECLER